MKRETNNEIDLLLRRLGRQDGTARNVEASGDDRHLDADELSSYAQNALPAAARARYTEHLAECATCRRLVTELSLSLGAATASVAATHEPSGWKKFVAALFSPLVLRYAAPALGVIAVVVVGFIVLRQQRQQEFVAQLQEANRPAPAAAPSSQTTPTEGFIDQQKQETESTNAKPSATKPKTEVVAGAANSVASADAPVTKDERAIDEVKPTVATTPAPAAPAKAADAEEPAAKTDTVAREQEQRKEKAADETAKAPAPASTRGFYSTEPAARTAQSAPKTESANTAGVGTATGGLARVRPGTAKRVEENKRDDDAARADTQYVGNETKTVAGRRFRKQGGIWTDTAYGSSTATVNMARDSEQFRALVADEPAIGTIAKQLEGEVIVVWKGRAYHIK